ncbi:MAG: NFACT RNA binding domain-containing protein [Spirochaetaceae bacterium]|jgi:predicted ribosome quality control (RQC) complex YloA/Tae2 family protein|nr:NFACT RNA binding domain-containing protein [Spirochaetaceae bacterium]
MSLNWKEINCILEELSLPGMQIRGVYQSAYDILALQVYGKTGCSKNPGDDRAGLHLVIISISPLACRIHETFRGIPKSKKPLRFAEFLKSRIVNSRIEEALQLGRDRIIRLALRRGENRWRLYIRLWSNAANVIVTGPDGTILDAMRRLPKRGEISGGVYRPGEGAGPSGGGSASSGDRVEGYRVRDLPGEGSFNSRVDRWYAEHGGKFSLERLREEARRITAGSMERLEGGLQRLREKEKDYANAERFKTYGDLILSRGPEKDPAPASSAGQSPPWLEVESFTGDEIIRIELDPRKSRVENAQAYYEKYRKAKNGLGDIRKEIAAGEKELDRLRCTAAGLLAEEDPLRLEGLLARLRRNRGPDLPGIEQKEEAARKRPGLSFTDGEWLLMVGRDAGENDELLRRHVKGNDLWLHVRDWAGAYVFIRRRPGKTVPLDVLLDAGNLALFYSKGRNNGRGDLYYTPVKYLRRVKNGPRGLVIPTQEKNLRITLDRERLKRLEGTAL